MLKKCAVQTPRSFIKKELASRGWTPLDLTHMLGVYERGVTLMLSGKRRISAEIAQSLGTIFKVQAEFFCKSSAPR